MTSARDLADRFHTAWLGAHPLTATSYGIPGHDAEVPDDSEDGDARWRAAVETFLAEGRGIDPNGLAPDEAVTLRSVISAAEQELDALAMAALEHTVTPMPIVGPSTFLSVAARTVLVDAGAAEDYLTRLRRSGTWLDQLTDRLRAGASSGRLPVAPLVEQAISWITGVLAPALPDAAVAPEPPADWVGAEEWRRARDEAAAAVVRPALERWLGLVEELAARSRPQEHAGLLHLPGGEEDYERAIRVHTTLPFSAQELHRLGLDEVDRLEARATALGATIGLDRLEDLVAAMRASAAAADPTEALAAATAAVRRAEAAAPEVFPAPLPPPCQVRPMPSVVAASGMAPHYSPPRLDGGRPGTFWFNTERPTAGTGWDLEGVAFHEAVPGHHLQLSRIQALEALPDFQRQRSFTVFSEGWGLYAEQLAEEIGLYSGPEALLGAVAASLFRAARLVVDTGLHAFGWSRRQAVEYMVAHVPMLESFLTNEVDRYIAWPGQALAYMSGKLEILRLRDESRRALGAGFSLPSFHAAVLDHGSLPMAVLETSVRHWVEQSRG